MNAYVLQLSARLAPLKVLVHVVDGSHRFEPSERLLEDALTLAVLHVAVPVVLQLLLVEGAQVHQDVALPSLLQLALQLGLLYDFL